MISKSGVYLMVHYGVSKNPWPIVRLVKPNVSKLLLDVGGTTNAKEIYPCD